MPASELLVKIKQNRKEVRERIVPESQQTKSIRRQTESMR